MGVRPLFHIRREACSRFQLASQEIGRRLDQLGFDIEGQAGGGAVG